MPTGRRHRWLNVPSEGRGGKLTHMVSTHSFTHPSADLAQAYLTSVLKWDSIQLLRQLTSFKFMDKRGNIKSLKPIYLGKTFKQLKRHSFRDSSWRRTCLISSLDSAYSNLNRMDFALFRNWTVKRLKIYQHHLSYYCSSSCSTTSYPRPQQVL